MNPFEFIIEQKDLLRAITIAASCTKSNSSNPSFSSIKISLNKKRVRIVACDTTSAISLSINGEGSGDGEVIMSPAPLLEYLGALGGGGLVLTLAKQGVLQISRGKSSASFTTTSVVDFPDISKPEGEMVFSCKVDGLLDVVKWAAISVATDETRPILTGLLMRKQESGKMVVVGSDGYRLSLADLVIEGEGVDNVLIPLRPFLSLLRDGGGVDSRIDFSINKDRSRLWAKMDDRVFYLNLLSGDFPDYTKILPKESLFSAQFQATEFVGAIKQVALFSRHTANIALCDLLPGFLRIYVKEGALGVAETSIDANVSGESITIAFNYRYLSEYIKQVGEGDIKMSCSGALAPVQFVSENHPGRLHVIMPVRV